MDRKKHRAVMIAAAAAIVSVAFTTDAVRTKYFGIPPVCCVPGEYLSDGVSRDYYGLGYKIWKDSDPFDGTTEYHISLWILPKAFNI